MRRATDSRDGGQGTRHRQVPAVSKPLLVTGDDGAFITFTPGDRSELQTLKTLRPGRIELLHPAMCSTSKTSWPPDNAQGSK